jgi:uncharacterized protein YqcC (DUF446 family)
VFEEYSMKNMHVELAGLLLDLEAELRDLALWDDKPPSAEALQSVQPFSVDTLDFYQWVQFIFIVRMKQLIEVQAPFPGKCEIAPMAEEYFKTLSLNGQQVIRIFSAVDSLLSAD